MSRGYSGASVPPNGTRFEFRLEHADDATRAEYRAIAFRNEQERTVRIEITAQGARVIEGSGVLESAVEAQLLALAKTLGKRAADDGWPRRVLRWRSPGVR